MATEQRNAGRRVVSQAEAQAITSKAGTGRTSGAPGGNAAATAPKGPGVNRREFLAYAMAGSTALFTVAGLALLTVPDPASDPLIGPIMNAVGLGTPNASGTVEYPVLGGFAYPRIKAGSFGGKFTVDRKADAFKTAEVPDLNAQGKFYIVKADTPVSADGSQANAQNIMAIYQVCTHLGCLIPYIETEKRFICPCHGSTFERNSQYVRGPAPRNLDQFPVSIGGDGTIIVDTGKKLTGVTHG